MENRELEEKIMIMEELIQGFIKRIDRVETETQTFFKGAFVHYKQTLSEIADSVKKASQPQENNTFIRQIEELKSLIATMPKVFTVKNNHYFGAWSKSFIIGVIIAFLITTFSLGTALYLDNENKKIRIEALNFWIVRVMYPDIASSIEENMKANRNNFVDQVEKVNARNIAIQMARDKVKKSSKQTKQTKKN